MFTEISIEPLPEHLEVDCDGEGSVIEAIDVCVFGAVDLILAKEEAERAEAAKKAETKKKKSATKKTTKE